MDTGVAGEPALLPFAGSDDALADRGGGFAGVEGREFLEPDPGDFDVDIDPVRQRAGDLVPVAEDLSRRAAAVSLGVAAPMPAQAMVVPEAWDNPKAWRADVPAPGGSAAAIQG
jgi:hypothetical protein